MSSPIDFRDQSDPGDQVIRKFRYQHAYGVILAVMMINKVRPYRAIWCEQHEDLLVEREDDSFDAFQVKTRKPETGSWNITDAAFAKSIKRFVDLDLEFPRAIKRFYFVSNAEYSNSDSKKNAHLSPIKLLLGVKKAQTHSEFSGNDLQAFEKLTDSCGRDKDALFLVLSRLNLVDGPTEKAFEDEICQSHLPLITECKGLTPGALSKVLDHIMLLLERAADVQCSDPQRHCVGLTSSDEDDPILLSKRVVPQQIVLAIRDACATSVQYPESLATIDLQAEDSASNVLRKKMERGGLGVNFEAMRRKALTAEFALTDVATRPGDGKRKISQVENVVLSECDEAHLRASSHGGSFGPRMLIDVQDRLKEVARDTPSKVESQPYEVLVGVSGLLTDACYVWWSEKFDMEKSQ